MRKHRLDKSKQRVQATRQQIRALAARLATSTGDELIEIMSALKEDYVQSVGNRRTWVRVLVQAMSSVIIEAQKITAEDVEKAEEESNARN